MGTRAAFRKKVRFTRLADIEREDALLVEQAEAEVAAGVADRVLEQLRALAGRPTPLRVDRLEHSLQTATRAHKDGADEELVVAALLHDIGDLLAPYDHGRLAAAILRPYVSDETHWVIAHHGIFQAYYYAHLIGGDRNARERYRDHPSFQAAVDFCHRYDMPAFDPDYQSLPLEFFEPAVRRLFARVPRPLDRI